MTLSVPPNCQILGRRFDDACGTAHGLELIGERWSLLVIRELLLGPRRFGDLRADLPGISANVLTQRLEELEARGIVRKERLPPPASVQVYGLTEWGYEAEAIIQVLGRWAARSPLHDASLPLSAVSIMISFRTMIDTARIGPLAGTRVSFTLGQHRFRAMVTETGIEINRESDDKADIRFTGSARALAAAVYGGVPIEQLGTAGALRAEGNADAIAHFLSLFVLPLKVTG